MSSGSALHGLRVRWLSNDGCCGAGELEMEARKGGSKLLLLLRNLLQTFASQFPRKFSADLEWPSCTVFPRVCVFWQEFFEMRCSGRRIAFAS
jgi:hypothetical protein